LGPACVEISEASQGPQSRALRTCLIFRYERSAAWRWNWPGAAPRARGGFSWCRWRSAKVNNSLLRGANCSQLPDQEKFSIRLVEPSHISFPPHQIKGHAFFFFTAAMAFHQSRVWAEAKVLGVPSDECSEIHYPSAHFEATAACIKQS
jgi:hypothetical protein